MRAALVFRQVPLGKDSSTPSLSPPKSRSTTSFPVVHGTPSNTRFFNGNSKLSGMSTNGLTSLITNFFGHVRMSAAALKEYSPNSASELVANEPKTNGCAYDVHHMSARPRYHVQQFIATSAAHYEKCSMSVNTFVSGPEKMTSCNVGRSL